MNFRFPACLHHLILLVWLTFIFFVGLWNYKVGFLLTRTVTENVSSCQDFSVAEFPKPWHLSLRNNRECWLPAKFEKSVVLLIDGLRFDFAYTPKSYQETKPYHNKMNIFRESVQRFPRNSFLAPFIADPPTTTLQRLQGLTTGTLPTFIDAGSNFQGDSMIEDSLVEQAVSAERKIVFLGDDTWNNLFPNKFHRSYFYPSFNVKDLHSVDEGILADVYDELNKTDWDIIVAHFLGVDHCGHRYGPDHPEMALKLAQMNAVIRNVMKVLPEDGVLFVLGDHGMTSSGDHGGDSSPELTSTFFVYSRKPLLSKPSHLNKLVPVPQVNFVPSFSLLLGLPIPFSSLGTIIPELFNDHELDPARALTLNALQVQRYLQTLPPIEGLQSKWERTRQIREDIEASANLSALSELSASYLDYLNGARESCSKQWTKFDVTSMSIGIYIVAAGVTLLAVLVFRAINEQLNIVNIGNRILQSALISISVSLLPWCVGYSQNVILDMCSVIAVCTVLFVFWGLFSDVSMAEADNRSYYVETFFSLLCLILHVGAFFSNSFIVREDAVSAFLVQTLFLVFVVGRFSESAKNKSNKRINLSSSLLFAASLTLLRVGQLFLKCREEHGPFCLDSDLIVAVRAIPDHWWAYRNARVFLALLCVLSFAVLFIYLMRLGRRVFGYDLSALFVSYVLPFVAICVCADWVMGLAPKKTLDKLLHKKQEVPAQSAAFLCCLVVGIISVLPVTVSREAGRVHPRWFRFHMTLVINQGLLLVSTIFLSFLLLGDGLSFSLVTLLVLLAILFTFLTIFRVKSPGTLWLFNVACILSAISSHGFFATGHQAVFSAIHWNSAFVISSGESIGRVLPALVILFETFSVQILVVILLHGAVSLSELLTGNEEEKLSSLLSQNLLSKNVRGILPSLSSRSNNPSVGYLSRFENSLLTLQLSFLLCQALKLLGAVASSFLLRRHLMVWKIFAPRLVFEAISFGMTSATLLAAHLLNLRLLLKLQNN